MSEWDCASGDLDPLEQSVAWLAHKACADELLRFVWCVEMYERSCQVCTFRPQKHTPCPDQALVYFRPLPVVLPYYSN